jgi:hypothetical protein
MSASFLRAASTRNTDAGFGLKASYLQLQAQEGNAYRPKVAELSEKVVDSNPYSRLMCVPAFCCFPSFYRDRFPSFHAQYD